MLHPRCLFPEEAQSPHVQESTSLLPVRVLKLQEACRSFSV